MFEFAVSSNWSLLRVAHSGLYGFPPFTRAESSKFYDDFDRGDKYPHCGFAAGNFHLYFPGQQACTSVCFVLRCRIELCNWLFFPGFL